MLGSPEKARESERVLQVERARYEQAEHSRLELQAELDLIQQQLVAEDERMERCRRLLDPEEQIVFEESKQAQTGLNHQSLTISEKILLKYKRATELCSMYEAKYQTQGQQIKELTL